MHKLLTLTACLALAACSQSGDDDSAAQNNAAQNNIAGESAEQSEITQDAATPKDGSADKIMPVEPDSSIGDGVARPMLEPMVYNDFAEAIEAGLGCSFIADGNKDALFVATGADDTTAHGQAAIKIGGNVVVLKQKNAGFDAMQKGGLYSSEAVEVTVTHGGGEPESTGYESWGWPATLKIAQDEAGSNSYKGKYECGA